MTIMRSILIIPANNEKFVEKALSRGADAIMLDLEDAIAAPYKPQARHMVKKAVQHLTKSGLNIQVRVNNDQTMLNEDLDASVHPGVDCVVIPKVETVEEVKALDTHITRLEEERNIPSGSVKLGVVIESPMGLLNLKKTATASSRAAFLSLGAEDYCFSLGVAPSREGTELFHAMSEIVTVAKASGLLPIGILGSIAGFKDLEGFERAAQRARNLGFDGAPCIHPDQVAVLNRIFSPLQEDVDLAVRIVSEFENALKDGKAAIGIEGKMVDLAVYNRAKGVCEKFRAIEDLENMKRKSRL